MVRGGEKIGFIKEKRQTWVRVLKFEKIIWETEGWSNIVQTISNWRQKKIKDLWKSKLSSWIKNYNFKK